jgi:hypothetical protein
MYATVNFRAIQPIYLCAVWKLKVPPRIMWLFSQNKIMTKDNLRTRGMVRSIECKMCKEFETVKHLMLECVVSRLLWEDVYEVFNIHVQTLNPLLPNGFAIRNSYIST